VLDRFASPPERAPQFPQPQQPYGQPQGQFGYAERPPQAFEGGGDRPHNNGERNNFQPRHDRPQQNRQDNRQDNRPPRPQYGERQDNRPDNRQDGGQQHNGQQRDFRNGENRPQREFRPYREMNPPPEQPQPRVDIPTPRIEPAQRIEAAPPREMAQPRLDLPQPELPAFITAAPRVPAPVESLGAPQPTFEPPVAAPAAPEAAIDGDVDARAPRGRRRRLRSPYGFQAGTDEAPAAAPNKSVSS
jgi:hypothetical protein